MPIAAAALAMSIGLATASAVTIESISASFVTATAEPYHLPPDKLAQAKALGHVRTALHFGSEFWGLAVLLLFLVSGAVSTLANWTSSKTGKGWLQSLLFSALFAALLYLIGQVPPEAIGHSFSLRYGISVQGWGSWLLDEAKTMALVVPIEIAILMLVFGLMRWSWSRKRYWIWMWVLSVPLILFSAFIEPQLIEPIFNTFEPLAQSHPELVRELDKVVVRTGTHIPPERMFLMKASEKSNGLNAYVSGFGASKRIVVWDTTADRMPVDEILFTFGHESGHYVLNHIPKGLTLGIVGLFALFGLTVWLGEWMVARWGGAWKISTLTALPGLAVLLLALTIWQIVSEPLSSAASRYFEHEADVYGQEAIHGIVAGPQKTAVAAFNDLGAAYLDDPDPNPFVEFWSYDHPSIQSRATFAAQYDPWVDGQSPRFFPK